jgi:hypothetical protein
MRIIASWGEMILVINYKMENTWKAASKLHLKNRFSFLRIFVIIR